MFREKRTHEKLSFLLHGKNRSLVIRLSCLLALCLVVSFTILHSDKAQLSKAAPASTDVTVDFGSRQNTTHPIPSSLFGIGGVGIGTVLNNVAPAVAQANFR